MDFDYAVHSDFLIHWTGKDIDDRYDSDWHTNLLKPMEKNVAQMYMERLRDILQHGLWMTEESNVRLPRDGRPHSVPSVPRTCFTELKLSRSMRHARRYGRLGIGVKRSFLFDRCGRPMIYYGFNSGRTSDLFLDSCISDLNKQHLLNFFKPMNSSDTFNYDLYGESEWRILYEKQSCIVDPRDSYNKDAHAYYLSLCNKAREKLKFLIPLDGWFAMIIYPGLMTKNMAQNEESFYHIKQHIENIKNRHDHGNRVEGGNWPIELDLGSCRFF